MLYLSASLSPQADLILAYSVSDGGEQYILIKPKVMSWEHYFDVPDGSRYHWTKDGVFTKNWTVRVNIRSPLYSYG